MNKSSFQLGGVSISPSSQRPPNFRQHILVVEDDPEIRRLNAEVLRCSGFQVDTAEDGAAAWARLEANSYDLLLTDNEMPGLSGLELLQRIHAVHLALPVIMATGIFPQEEADRHPWLPIEAVLLKPYSIDELLEVVKNVLHRANRGRLEICPPNWQQPATPLGRQLR